MNPTELLHPVQRLPSKAYVVNALRKAVYGWREEGYPDVTPTTRRLLQFWSNEDHIINNEPLDWQSSIPIKFLTVERTRFQFYLASRDTNLLDKTEQYLKEALKEFGIGAKTSLGYGIFTD